MKTINWGMIGCGDVTEVKSGPAFNKVDSSVLMAVMRRDAAKARDYAERHAVPQWYNDAAAIINNPAINAVYIATPPSSHEEYAIAALKAGKMVYVEKPVTTDPASAQRMLKAVQSGNGKLVVAHYRRAQPLFKKLNSLLKERVIGDIRCIQLRFFKKPLTAEELQVPKTAWRVNPSIAGGGLFHDLAPHQLDILYHFFGPVRKAIGYSSNQAGLYAADDIVMGMMEFEAGMLFSGSWCFASTSEDETDLCEIIGSKGNIRFSFFDHHPIKLSIGDNHTQFAFEPLRHVQQPMIEQTVQYFLGKAPNPCSMEEAMAVTQLLDDFTRKKADLL